MVFADLIRTMTQAIARGDGEAAAACFSENGVYHDVFYGAFPKAQIPSMVLDYFHRDGERFMWDIHDPMSDGNMGYARYVFSYDAKIKGAQGKRAIFEGGAICTLEDGLILSYREVANAVTGLHMLGFAPERMNKIVAREVRELTARDETAAHLGQ